MKRCFLRLRHSAPGVGRDMRLITIELAGNGVSGPTFLTMQREASLVKTLKEGVEVVEAELVYDVSEASESATVTIGKQTIIYQVPISTVLLP